MRQDLTGSPEKRSNKYLGDTPFSTGFYHFFSDYLAMDLINRVINMNNLKRAKLMLAIIVFGLLVSGITVWPAIPELKTDVRMVWGDIEPTGVLHSFVLQAIAGLESMNSNYPFMLYAHDWLAFAHIGLAILFAGAIKDPIRNIWIVQCGLIMCALIPVLAGICIPIRGIPFILFWIDFAFAPAAALPLWIALRDIKRTEARLKKA